MSEFAAALRTLFGKISAFFDLFDLSFFVSGSVCLSALVFWAHLANRQLPFELQGWIKVLAVILACYVNGLLCFAAGRLIRWGKPGKTIEDFNAHFLDTLRAHGLAEEKPFKDYLDRTSHLGIRRLYIRLWAEARQTDQLSPSLSVINRYWVMAATYDGLSVALLLWSVTLINWMAGFGVGSRLSLTFGLPAIILLIVMSRVCIKESRRLVRNQAEELVASVAAQRSRLKA